MRLINAVSFRAILPVPGRALSPDQVFDKVKDAVVVVKTLDVQGKVKGQGSGVILSSDRVATNYRVTEGGVSYQAGRDGQLVPATLYAEDGDRDICLLDAKGIRGKPAQLGKAARLKKGDPVYAVGASQGLELSLSSGIVAQLRGGRSPLIQTTATISPGSSGGGLFDGQGRLVGLTTFYLEDGKSLNFAMPVEWIGKVKAGRKSAAKGRGHTEWLNRAIALEATKDWQGLLDWCGKWIKSQLKNGDAWYGLGNAYGELDRYDDAIEAYCQAIRIDPEYADAWYNLGIAHRRLDRYDDAIEAYCQAIRIDPEYAKAWNNLGSAYDDLKRYDKAIEAYCQAIGTDPKHAPSWHNLGLAYRHLDCHDDAMEAFGRVIRIDPSYARIWYNLGLAYRRLDRYDDAIEAFRQVIRIDPKHTDAWSNLGVAYSLSGNQIAALGTVRELQRLDPAQADKLFNLIAPR